MEDAAQTGPGKAGDLQLQGEGELRPPDRELLQQVVPADGDFCRK